MKKRTLIFCLFLLTMTGPLSQGIDSPKIVDPSAGRKQEEQVAFRIRFSYTDGISTIPVNGRIIVGFHGDTSKPINNPDLLDPQPTFAWDVSDWKPGESIVLNGSTAVSWAGNLDSLNGWYGVQAILRTNRNARSLEAVGNAVTRKKIVHIQKGEAEQPLELFFEIKIDRMRKFRETELLKEINIPSNLLTRFYGRPDSIQAAVILPRSYFQETGRQYPSVYVLGGFGSSHLHAMFDFPQKRYGMAGYGEEKIFIYVNHECRSGYHVFCSSETNGPREESFFQELVPAIEKEYRVDKNPATRFLMGQSSGAWGGLWLLINHPDQFGGAYVASPDPVDFTDFTGTNIYQKNANLFFGPSGEIKFFSRAERSQSPLARISIKDFVGLDRIAGYGEQSYSFDAAFSKKGCDGEPLHLFNWETGEVDPAVAASWEKHDLSRIVSRLGGKTIGLLRGKIHIYVSEDDDFGLDRPVRIFQTTIANKGLEAEIRFLPSGGHDIWTDELRKIIHEDMDRIIRLAAPNGK